MHPKFQQADQLTGEIINAAIEVHKLMGPGLLESVYEWCLIKELEDRGHTISQQENVVVRYKSHTKEELLRYDLLVDDCVLVEAKAVEAVHPIHKAQLISYLKLLDIPVGLLINFNQVRLTDGVSRLILPGANK